MAKFSEQDTIEALLVFADIIDSSKYSAILGYTEYANRLLNFQDTFKSLSQRYFPAPHKSPESYCHADARGDEGIIFYASTEMDFGENISRAIAFLFHLKAHLRFVFSEENVDCAPQQLGIGGGIHVGKVAFAKELKDKRSVIDHLEGFAINYAKRIESCSRSGKYSRVFLSKEAVGFLKDAPILFSNSVEPLKGIEDKAEVYEVQSGLLEMKFDEQDFGDKQLIREAKRLAKSPKDIDEAWIKSFIVSVLDLLHRNALMINIQKDYYKKQLEFAWRDPIEDDPILLYIRARDFSIKKEFTQQMRYLKEILNKYPKFIHAKKRLIEACWQITKGKSEPAELIYARDMAKEFIECYPYLLTDSDKKQFQDIIYEVEKNAKRK